MIFNILSYKATIKITLKSVSQTVSELTKIKKITKNNEILRYFY